MSKIAIFGDIMFIQLLRFEQFKMTHLVYAKTKKLDFCRVKSIIQHITQVVVLIPPFLFWGIPLERPAQHFVDENSVDERKKEKENCLKTKMVSRFSNN